MWFIPCSILIPLHFASDFIGWVPDVLRLLAVSRSGLTANEILDILVAIGYQENVKVTQFDWLMFLRCLGANVTESPYGVFNFAHQHMREVVEYILLSKRFFMVEFYDIYKLDSMIYISWIL